MTNRRAVCFLVTIIILATTGLTIGVKPSAADCGYSQALRAHLTRQRGMLLAIIATMPEDKYEFKPTTGVRSFREMVEHLIEDTYSHSGYVMGKSRAESEKIAAQNSKGAKTRAEYLEALKGAFDYGDKMLAGITDENAMDIVGAMRGEKVTRLEAALQLFEDQMDHYGNFVVYVRMNGIVPPDTADRQRQMKERMDRDHQ